MFRRVLSKTIAMHGKGIVHYDLKCDNVLVVEKQGGAQGGGTGLRLVDFGEAHVHPGRTTRNEGACFICFHRPILLS